MQQRNSDDDQAGAVSSDKKAQPKRVYRSPRLAMYGKLREIAMGEKGREKVDGDPGGVSATRR